MSIGRQGWIFIFHVASTVWKLNYELNLKIVKLRSIWVILMTN